MRQGYSLSTFLLIIVLDIVPSKVRRSSNKTIIIYCQNECLDFKISVQYTIILHFHDDNFTIRTNKLVG